MTSGSTCGWWAGAADRSSSIRRGFALDLVGATFTVALDLVAVGAVLEHRRDGRLVGGAGVRVVRGRADGVALAELLVGHLDKLPVELRAGTFDMVLLQPRRQP